MSDTTVEPRSHKLKAKVSRKAVLIGTAVVGALSVATIAVLAKNRKNDEIEVLEPTEDSTED